MRLVSPSRKSISQKQIPHSRIFNWSVKHPVKLLERAPWRSSKQLQLPSPQTEVVHLPSTAAFAPRSPPPQYLILTLLSVWQIRGLWDTRPPRLPFDHAENSIPACSSQLLSLLISGQGACPWCLGSPQWSLWPRRVLSVAEQILWISPAEYFHQTSLQNFQITSPVSGNLLRQGRRRGLGKGGQLSVQGHIYAWGYSEPSSSPVCRILFRFLYFY